MIEAENLTRTFGSLTAVNNLNLHIAKGEVFGFLGPNGAGKTTTIRMLACLIAPTKGTATVAGYNIQKDPLKVRQSVGILMKIPVYMNAYPHMRTWISLRRHTESLTQQNDKKEFGNCWSSLTYGNAETTKSQASAKA
jgi:ABC-2 type transport system ATP-binding protein